MNTFTIQPTNGTGCTFEGALLVDARGDQLDEVAQGRCHDIRVYRRDDDRFVVEIGFQTRHPQEKTTIDLETVDTFKDVELVLQIYQPNEYLDRSLLRQMSDESRKRMMVQLFTNYDNQVASVLRQLANFEDSSQKTTAELQTAQPVGWRQLFGLLGGGQEKSPPK